METESSFEAVVIGSGIGGLSVGILLAGLGLRTLVCEGNALAGGLVRGYRRGGLDLPVGLHYIGAFGEREPLRRICDLLGVSGAMAAERMGQGGPIDRYVFSDRELCFDLPEGLEAYREALSEAFPADRQAIAALAGQVRQVAALQNRFAFLAPQPELLPAGLLVSLEDHLNHWSVSPGLRGVLGIAARWMGMSERECPLFYHHLALASYLSSSWRLTGTGVELAEALVSRFKELGGSLSCGDPVRSLRMQGGQVVGVGLASGREVRSGRVIAAIHPKKALAMLPEDAVKPRHRRQIGLLAETEGLFALSALVDGGRHPALPYNLFRLHSGPSGAVRSGLFCQLRPGPPGKSLLIAMTRSPYGEWAAWAETQTGRRGPAYAEEKGRRAEQLLGETEALLGSLRGAEVIDCYTPLSLRDWMDCPEGAPYGIVRSLRQLPLAGVLPRLAPPGLWFAGQNALSPGILGTLLGSLHTLRQIIGAQRFAAEVYRPLAGF